jgi:hypothetical protein
VGNLVDLHTHIAAAEACRMSHWFSLRSANGQRHARGNAIAATLVPEPSTLAILQLALLLGAGKLFGFHRLRGSKRRLGAAQVV